MFTPAWWLRNPHLQTLWASKVRDAPNPPPAELAEELTLPDGDFIELAWTADLGGPIAIVLHGLEGSAKSPYAAGLCQSLTNIGWTAVVVQMRGCGERYNRLDRSYFAGDSGDINFAFDTVKQRYPDRRIAVIGYSLGGNIILKWLGELGAEAGADCAIAISVPFDLSGSANALNRGFSRVYQRYLVGQMVDKVRGKFAGRTPPVRLDHLSHTMTFWDFDNDVTAPLHGFTDVHDYYKKCSSRQFLASIRIPTLLLQAADDPFLEPSGVPAIRELNASTRLELSARGGHVGFLASNPDSLLGCGLTPWLETRIPTFLRTGD